jgi:hypothetical protein
MSDTITRECKICEEEFDSILAIDDGYCDNCQRRMKQINTIDITNLPDFSGDNLTARDQFLIDLEQTYATALNIVRKKNQDYATSDNPFKNFENCTTVGVSPARGILVRVIDKITRVSNLLDKPNAVQDETIDDTILDIINYLAILKAMIKKD